MGISDGSELDAVERCCMRNLAESLDDECAWLPCAYPLRDLRGLGPCLEPVRDTTWLEFDGERVGVVVKDEVRGGTIGASVDVELRGIEDELDFLKRSSSAEGAGCSVSVGVRRSSFEL